jgi:hypothetical protein
MTKIFCDSIEKESPRILNSQAFVGVAGFEPATSSSQTRRDDRATLHPEFYVIAMLFL